MHSLTVSEFYEILRRVSKKFFGSNWCEMNHFELKINFMSTICLDFKTKEIKNLLKNYYFKHFKYILN